VVGAVDGFGRRRDSSVVTDTTEPPDEPALPLPVKVPACELTAVEFDFEAKKERDLPLRRLSAAMDAGRFVWVDVNVHRVDGAAKVIADLNLVSDELIEDALTNEPATQHARYPKYLHMVVSGCRLQGRHFELERVDIVVGERFLLTIHHGPAVFLESVKRDYSTDFQRFARSPSFLVYELWDHLTDNYVSVQKKFEDRVERLQQTLIGEVDDRVFAQISEISADLLYFRKILLPARAVLTDLSTRKSIFISEATQPFLANMVGTLERVLQDLMADRDILSASLNLYMSLVGHRTNRVMNRLTVVSAIFLPLSFLCGVYGMNFEIFPEVHWRYGYLFFWGLAGSIVVSMVLILRRTRLL
jgi:magnesium transporter